MLDGLRRSYKGKSPSREGRESEERKGMGGEEKVRSLVVALTHLV